MTISNNRSSEYPIDAMFLDRWSPRAFVNETMEESTLLTMLDAAHGRRPRQTISPGALSMP